MADVVAAAEAATRGVAPFPVRLAGAGAFPSAARPRVVWLGLAEGSPQLEALAAGLGRELTGRGWPEDERPFRGHLTLARADGVPGAQRVVEVLAAGAATLDAGWSVDRLVVYQSLAGRGGTRYLPLANAILGGESEMRGGTSAMLGGESATREEPLR